VCFAQRNSHDNSMPVNWNDLLLAYDFSAEPPSTSIRLFCASHQVRYWRCDSFDELDELSDDFEGSQKAASDEIDELPDNSIEI
jgi:hypothetical protein